MIINGFGVSLERLCEKDLELVREKRNSQLISQFMEFRGFISPQIQQEWFASINTINNLYYVISYNNKKVGLINGAKIDWQKMETASGGIFIWEEELWQTYVPLMANMVLMDIAFLLGLKRSFVKIMNDNKRAIQYNTLLGYKVWSEEESDKSKIYVLDTENYLQKTKTLRKYLHKNYGTDFEIIVDDADNQITQFLLEKVVNMPSEYRSKLNIVYGK
ncbi:N/A [soil metagenome]